MLKAIFHKSEDHNKLQGKLGEESKLILLIISITKIELRAIIMDIFVAVALSKIRVTKLNSKSFIQRIGWDKDEKIRPTFDIPTKIKRKMPF